MKKLFNTVFVLLVACAQTAMAQSTAAPDKKTGTQWFVGITGGASILSGNFAKTDYADNTSGFAGTGMNIGVTGTYFITKYFGINALVSYHGYTFKGAQNIADGFKESFDIDSSTVNAKGSNYTMNFLIGPYYSLPISKKLSVDFRILAGLTSAHIAGYQVAIEDQGAATFSQNESSASSFAAQAGAELKYSFTPHLALALNVDYYYSDPNFTIDNVNRNNNAGRYITSYHEPVTALNTNLTLIYQMHR